MPTATVTVQGKADPERGKKRGRIKGDTGMLFQADPGFLNQVIVGSTYDLTYRDDEYNGTKFRVVEGVAPSVGRPPAPVPSPGGSTGQRRYEPAPSEDRRGEDIATLAIVKEWIGRIPVGDEGALVHALRVARRAWLKFKSGSDPKIESGPSMRDEMEDDIPEFPGDR